MNRFRAAWSLVHDMPSPYASLALTGKGDSAVEVGTSTNQANKAAVLRTTLAGSGSVNVDFNDLSTPSGAATLNKVVALVWRVLTPGGTLNMAPGASNGWTGLGSGVSIDISAEGMWVWVYPPGKTVDSTHKILTCTNPGATSIDIELFVLGLDT